MPRTLRAILVVGGLVVVCGVAAFAEKGKPAEESERTVKESEVPHAALLALKKLAAGAVIREFTEELEHGHTFYEGSWKGADGNVDALVTPTGDLVELEEMMPAERVPSAVRAALHKAAGDTAPLSIERKTLYIYEGHFKKDGKGHELQLTPDGREYSEEDGDDGERDEADED